MTAFQGSLTAFNVTGPWERGFYYNAQTRPIVITEASLGQPDYTPTGVALLGYIVIAKTTKYATPANFTASDSWQEFNPEVDPAVTIPVDRPPPLLIGDETGSNRDIAGANYVYTQFMTRLGLIIKRDFTASRVKRPTVPVGYTLLARFANPDGANAHQFSFQIEEEESAGITWVPPTVTRL